MAEKTKTPKPKTRPKPKKPTYSLQPDYTYCRLRDEITYEATRIDNRSSWFVTSQAFFFGSLAIGIDHKDGIGSIVESIYFPIIPILAIVSAFMTIISVIAAIKRANTYRGKLNAFVEKHEAFQEIWPKSDDQGLTTLMGISKATLVPFIFLATWVGLIVFALIPQG